MYIIVDDTKFQQGQENLILILSINNIILNYQYNNILNNDIQNLILILSFLDLAEI